MVRFGEYELSSGDLQPSTHSNPLLRRFIYQYIEDFSTLLYTITPVIVFVQEDNPECRNMTGHVQD